MYSHAHHENVKSVARVRAKPRPNHPPIKAMFRNFRNVYDAPLLKFLFSCCFLEHVMLLMEARGSKRCSFLPPCHPHLLPLPLSLSNKNLFNKLNFPYLLFSFNPCLLFSPLMMRCRRQTIERKRERESCLYVDFRRMTKFSPHFFTLSLFAMTRFDFEGRVMCQP